MFRNIECGQRRRVLALPHFLQRTGQLRWGLVSFKQHVHWSMVMVAENMFALGKERAIRWFFNGEADICLESGILYMSAEQQSSLALEKKRSFPV